MHKLLKKSIFLSSIIAVFLFNFVYSNDTEYEEDNTNINEILQETSSNLSDIPNIYSKSAVLIDRNSNTILYGKNENEIRKMASTTKIMTSLVVIENCNLEDIVTASKKAAGTGGSRLGLKSNDKITVNNLLYGLMLCSGNDAAVALAEHVGGSIEGFAELMNKKANDLGLNNTHFVTPHGLDSDNHYTTALELAYLTNYALNNDTFAKIVNTKTATISINSTTKTINNTNELLGALNGVYGVKTGFTNGANRCLVTSCKRDNLDIICVVLGADTKKIRTQDSIKLIEYAFSAYTTVDIQSLANTQFSNWVNSDLKINIKKSSLNSLDLKLDYLPYNKVAIPKDQIDDINIFIEAENNLEAPIYANTKIGHLEIKIGDNTLCSIGIINNSNISKRAVIDYFLIFVKNYYSLLLKK